MNAASSSRSVNAERRPVLLLVDDDLDVRDSAGPWLRDQGFEVFTAADGGEAIDVMRSTTPDVLVLDLMMPGMNGWSVWDWVQAHFDAPPPVVIWTASGLRTGAVGSAPIVSKGDHPSTLLQAIERQLI